MKLFKRISTMNGLTGRLNNIISNLSIKGYICGGNALATNKTIDKIIYATEVISLISSVFTKANSYSAGVQNSNFGYLIGGRQSGYAAFNSSDRISFTTEAIFTGVFSTIVDIGYTAGVSSASAGYIGAGFTYNYSGSTTVGTSTSSKVYKLLFDTETYSLISNLSLLPRNSVRGIFSSLVGYFVGGYESNYSTEIDGIFFTTDTKNNPAAKLSVGKTNHATFNSSLNGYICAGSALTGSSKTIEAFSFSQETINTITNGLTTAVSACSGSSTSSSGYLYGGVSASSVVLKTVNKLLFDTNTNTTLTATLSTARATACSFN